MFAPMKKLLFLAWLLIGINLTPAAISKPIPHYELHLVCTSGDKDSPQGKSSLRFSERIAETRAAALKLMFSFKMNSAGRTNSSTNY